MGFTSFIFPFFLAVVLLGYYLLPQKVTWFWLLVASWFFYGYGNLAVFLLLPAYSLVTYLGGILIEKGKSDRVKKSVMIITLLIVFGGLFVFKYLGLFAESAISLARLFGAKLDDFTVKIILPVGISFYTFQTASYVVDVYLGKIKAEKHFGYYALFVSFFPQLVAGPIERTDRLLPQLKVRHAFEIENVKHGALMMACGYVKKVAVADVIARVVEAVYSSSAISELSALAVFVATALFLVQIYCDFSGYSDIAVGVARLMGIRLMQNFKQPFLSRTVTEFWGRWHVSLSAWFNEYVYRPLSFFSMRKKNRMFWYAVNTLIVMFLSGLWHGADWSFVLWGLLLAFFQIAETFLTRGRAKSDKHKWLKRGRTILLLILSLVLFRASNIAQAWLLYGRLILGWNSGMVATFTAQTTLTLPYAVSILAGILAVFMLDKFVTFDGGDTYVKKGDVVTIITVFICLWLVLFAWSWLTENGQVNSFIYFQF